MAKGCLATVIQTERNKEKKKSQRSPVWLCCVSTEQVLKEHNETWLRHAVDLMR